ncbi:MAG: hypothetical protein ACAI25_09905 [Planctomycetota bacterium]
MSNRMRSYWVEVATVAMGVAAAAAVMPHGREAVFNVGLLTAAALSASSVASRRRIAA